MFLVHCLLLIVFHHTLYINITNMSLLTAILLILHHLPLIFSTSWSTRCVIFSSCLRTLGVLNTYSDLLIVAPRPMSLLIFFLLDIALQESYRCQLCRFLCHIHNTQMKFNYFASYFCMIKWCLMKFLIKSVTGIEWDISYNSHLYQALTHICMAIYHLTLYGLPVNGVTFV